MTTNNIDDPPKFTPPPIQHVSPPPDFDKRPPRVLIYGYPITNELINLRYDIIKASHPNITRNNYFPHLSRFLEKEIRELHPEGKSMIRVVLAETAADHEGGSIPLLAVGVPGRKPPAHILREITEVLGTYGVIEKPGWYPKMYARH